MEKEIKMTEKDIQFRDEANKIATEIKELVMGQQEAGLVAGAILVICTDLEGNRSVANSTIAVLGRNDKVTECILTLADSEVSESNFKEAVIRHALSTMSKK